MGARKATGKNPMSIEERAAKRQSLLDDSQWRIQQEMATFPKTFGLRAFDGVFTISERASYADRGRPVMLHTQRLQPDGSWTDFAKGTADELRGEIVRQYAPEIEKLRKQFPETFKLEGFGSAGPFRISASSYTSKGSTHIILEEKTSDGWRDVLETEDTKFLRSHIESDVRENPMNLQSGYAYVYDPSEYGLGRSWKTVMDEAWETEVIAPSQMHVRHVGRRNIDGSPVEVFHDQVSNAYVAQAAQMVRNGRDAKGEKIVAHSFERYRGGAREKRLHGGQGTITRFYVYYESDRKDAAKWAIIDGHGPTPGERKTDAIRRFLAAKVQGNGRLPGDRAGEGAYVDGHPGYPFVPDKKITKDKAEYVYRPMRGYSSSVAVEGIDGNIIGWMPIDVLGYPDVKTWMKAVRYVIQGDGATRRNPQRNHGDDPHTLTWGVMPPLADFREHLSDYYDYTSGERQSVKDGDPKGYVFYGELASDDIEAGTHAADAVTGVNFSDAPHDKIRFEVETVAALHEWITSLVHHAEDGNEQAGDLASSMMSVLGYDWV